MKINQNDVPQEVWIPEHSQDPNNLLGRLVASLSAGSPVLDYIYIYIYIYIYTRNTARASRALSFLVMDLAISPWIILFTEGVDLVLRNAFSFIILEFVTN
jgi:hypothetical protein